VLPAPHAASTTERSTTPHFARWRSSTRAGAATSSFATYLVLRQLAIVTGNVQTGHLRIVARPLKEIWTFISAAAEYR
jgi:hypothetical protein